MIRPVDDIFKIIVGVIEGIRSADKIDSTERAKRAWLASYLEKEVDHVSLARFAADTYYTFYLHFKDAGTEISKFIELVETRESYAAEIHQLLETESILRLKMLAYEAPIKARSAVAKKAAAASKAKDPRTAPMSDIRSEFDRWQAGESHYKDVASFARKMHAKHAGTIENEVSIKNAVTRWRKESSS